MRKSKQTNPTKTRKKLTQNDWCTLVAWLINCDNEQFHFTETVYTAESCWHYNSHGELFGLLNSIQSIMEIFKTKALKQEFMDRCTEILKGQIIKPDKEYASGLGMYCITQMYRCSDEFVGLTHKIIKSRI